MVTGSKNWTGLEGLNSNSKYRSAFVLFLFFKLLPTIQYYFFPVLKNTLHSLEQLWYCRIYVKGVSALGESADSNEVIVNFKSNPEVTPPSPNTKTDKDDDNGSGSGSRKPSG